MGRKSSSKAKEKKLKKKEENAVLNAAITVVQTAEDLDDPMDQLLPFKKFERNGLTATISCYRVKDMDQETQDWVFQLTKDNMEALYEGSGWGWNDKQKQEEMMDEKSRYLVVRNQDNKPLAMVHFRFDVDEDIEVLYCYEIQLVKEARRKGLGKFLIQILELMAYKTQMKKVMCTVFKNNPDAQDFFKKTLNYTLDETNPEESYAEAMFDEEGYTYEIISKDIKSQKTKKEPLQPIAQQANQVH